MDLQVHRVCSLELSQSGPIIARSDSACRVRHFSHQNFSRDFRISSPGEGSQHNFCSCPVLEGVHYSTNPAAISMKVPFRDKKGTLMLLLRQSWRGCPALCP